MKGKKAEKAPILIADDQVGGRSSWLRIGGQVCQFCNFPRWSAGAFGAHNEVFTVPAKNGNTRNFTNTSGIHERSSTWSLNGKWIAFISDASGEDEILIVPQDGSSPARQATRGADTYKFDLLWSPGSSKILWNAKKQRL